MKTNKYMRPTMAPYRLELEACIATSSAGDDFVTPNAWKYEGEDQASTYFDGADFQ